MQLQSSILLSLAACAASVSALASSKAHYFHVTDFNFEYIPHGDNNYELTVSDTSEGGTGLQPVKCSYSSGDSFENLATFNPKAICAKNMDVLIGLQQDDLNRFVLSIAFDGQKGYKLFPLAANKYRMDHPHDGFEWEYIKYNSTFDVPYN